MLLDLEVRDLAIIDHLRVGFTSGLNVVTGETGAGKSILVDALGLLLGDRADSEVVRAGAERAVVDGRFDVGALRERVGPVLEAYGVDLDTDLVVSREVLAAGRSSARINGRPVPVKALAELGAVLVDIHGQSENASLLRESEHIQLLDRHAGLGPERREMAELVARASALLGDLARLQQDEALLARRAELLAFEVEEIEAARLSEAEEAALLAERLRLTNAERLVHLSDTAYAALREGPEGSGEPGLAALDLLEVALEAVEGLVRIDSTLAASREQLAELASELADVADVVRDYRDGLEFSPSRRDEMEERLALISDLKRKYGPEIADVLRRAERAAKELADITGSEARIADLSAEREALLIHIGRLAGVLSSRRRAAAETLSAGVVERLAELALGGCRFEVSLQRRPDLEGVPVEDGSPASQAEGRPPSDSQRYAFDSTGVDGVAFLVSMNPGEPPRPLARVASGGETARLMLALKSVLSGADELPTLVFDEIDTGVGGRVGTVVGEKLWELAHRHQVLCVTHLPQVAVYGDTHLKVSKVVEAGRTRAVVQSVQDEARADEVMHMLGPASNIARENAITLLQRSEQWKLARRGPANAGAAARDESRR